MSNIEKRGINIEADKGSLSATSINYSRLQSNLPEYKRIFHSIRVVEMSTPKDKTFIEQNSFENMIKRFQLFINTGR